MSPPADPPRAWWTCPDCGFTFDAAQTFVVDGGHLCPVCENARLLQELVSLRAGMRRLMNDPH